MKENNHMSYISFSNEFKEFATIPITIFLDKRLSYNALGIYCQLITFQYGPIHSEYNIDLTYCTNDNYDTIESGLSELLELGYIEKEILKNETESFCKEIYKVFTVPKKF